MTDWPEHVLEILRNDRCVALATRTPAAGVVLTPVTTVGEVDPDRKTVTTTTSLGNFGKLRSIDHDDRVAVVFHARDHSATARTEVVVAQGRASFPVTPDPRYADPSSVARWEEFMPARKRGRVWDWVGREYYEARVPITVHVERLVILDGADHSVVQVLGVQLGGEPAAQTPPSKGTGPRVPARKYGKRLAKSRHHLLGWVDATGFPTAVPVTVEPDGDLLRLQGTGVPAGGRRAGFLSHWFDRQLVGQGSVVATGWLDHQGTTCTYSPHSVTGYDLPASEFAFAVAGGLASKFGYRKAERSGFVDRGTGQR
ncbi:MAG: hypothetical protein ACKO04_17160 [Actinomycetes bacterium]